MQNKNMNENVKVEKNENVPAVDPLTGKRIMLGCGATGFAMCLGGVIYGNQVFILGFVVMLLSAAGFYVISRKN